MRENLDLFPEAERVLTASRPTNPEWEKGIAHLLGLRRYPLIYKTNVWINKIPYVDDMSNYGVPDFWQTPDEFFDKGGDCEDYAIAKYTALRELHVPADDMFIIIGRFTKRNIAHAVLSVAVEDKLYYLSNENNLPLETVEDFVGFYKLNENGVYVLRTPKLGKDT